MLSKGKQKGQNKMKVILVLAFLSKFVSCDNQASCKCEFWAGSIIMGECAYIYDCGDTKKPLQYTVNETIELCCKVGCKSCVQGETFLTVEKCPHPTNTVAQMKSNSSSDVSCFGKITIPSVSEEDLGESEYCCFDRTTRDLMFHTTVIVKDDLKAPEISLVVVRFDEDSIALVIHFNSYEDPHWFYSYEVFKEEELLCNSQVECLKGKCKCVFMYYEASNPLSIVVDKNVSISITKKTSNQVVKTTESFNLIQHIQPGTVTKFKINKDCPAITVKFCAPQDLQYLVEFMEYRRRPLIATVEIIKLEGLYEEREFNFTFNDMARTCVNIPVKHLTPFTQYNVSVTLAGGGGSGKTSTQPFLSCKSAPLSPPNDVRFWFAEDVSSAESPKKQYTLNINWKSPAHDVRGGRIWYQVIAAYGNKTFFETHQIADTSVMLANVSDLYISVKVYTVNEMGSSQNYSYLNIDKPSSHKSIAELESHVECEEQKARIFIQKASPDVVIHAIYGCVGNQSGSIAVCKDFPSMFSLVNTDDKQDMISDLISLKRKRCQENSKDTTYEGNVEFFSKDRPRRKTVTQKITANVTSYVQTEKEECFPVSHEAASKTFVIDEHHEWKFFFSVKKKGEEIQELFPFKCYYDSKSSNVMLHINQYPLSDKVTISWKQVCESSQPHQFFASRFEVFASKNSSCQKPVGKITAIENIIFKESTHNWKEDVYACIDSIHSSLSGAKKSKLKYFSIDKQVSGDTESPLKIIIPIIVVFLVLVGLVLFLWKRKDFGNEVIKPSWDFSIRKAKENLDSQDKLKEDDSCELNEESYSDAIGGYHRPYIADSDKTKNDFTEFILDKRIDSSGIDSSGTESGIHSNFRTEFSGGNYDSGSDNGNQEVPEPFQKVLMAQGIDHHTAFHRTNIM